MKQFLLLALFAFGATSVASAQVTIDDFSSGAYGVTLGGFDSAVNEQTGSMLGGFRFTDFFIDQNPYNQQASVSIDPNGIDGSPIPGLFVSGGVGVATTLDLEYFPTGGLAGADGFSFDFLTNDHALNYSVEVISSSGAADAAGTIGANENPFTFALSGSSFNAAIDWNSVDDILVIFNSAPNGDYALQDVKATPEPASLLALGLGSLGLLARRRRR